MGENDILIAEKLLKWAKFELQGFEFWQKEDKSTPGGLVATGYKVYDTDLSLPLGLRIYGGNGAFSSETNIADVWMAEEEYKKQGYDLDTYCNHLRALIDSDPYIIPDERLLIQATPHQRTMALLSSMEENGN